MPFGSTRPTLLSQTALQLEWDCRQNEGATRQLIDSWIATTKSHSGTVLDEAEQRTITNILRTETSQVIAKIEALLRMDHVYFERVRSQLFSLLIAWEQAILEKKRYEEEGLRIDVTDDRAQLNPHEFMILFQTVYFRAQAGLATLPIPTKSHLTSLPREIQIEILSHLPNLQTLFAARLIHRSFRDVYTEYSRSISLAIFRQRCSQVQGRNISGVFWELVFALDRGCMDIDVKKELFVYGWTVFRTHGLEDLLVPLGRDLALLYSRERRGDATKLLQELADGSGEFGRSGFCVLSGSAPDRYYSKIIRYPVFKLLGKWEEEETGESDGPEKHRSNEVKRMITNYRYDRSSPLCIAKIGGAKLGMRFGNPSGQLLSKGITVWRDEKRAIVPMLDRGQLDPDLGLEFGSYDWQVLDTVIISGVVYNSA